MRRSIDVAVASTALVILSPLLLVVALLVVVDSPGSPFYGGRRIGANGVPFRMWKFRSMVANADKGASITGKNDPRVTRVGRVLRNTKIDELPQLVNLLVGDMTLVGPRPEAPDLVALYSKEQRQVLSVKPGITGPAQLSAGDESESLPAGAEAREYYVRHLMPQKIRSDLEYLRTQDLSKDAQILFATAAYVLKACFRR